MSRFLPSDAWVRLLVVPVLVFISLASSTNYLADFWHHLARGREIVNRGQLLDEDIFTYTVAGTHFMDPNWGSQVLYCLFFQVGDLDLVRVLNALLTAGTFAWLIVLCWRRSGSLIAAMIVAGLTFFSIWQVLTIRPQTFSFFFFVALLDILDRAPRQSRLLIIPPFIIAVWANMHGAFPAGLILLGGHLVAAWWDNGFDRWFGRLLLCLVISTAATAINPYGPMLWQYVFHTSSTSANRQIEEWLRPGLDKPIGIAFYLSFLVLAALLFKAIKQRRVRASDCLLLAGFGILALGSVRMVAWWFWVLAPVLSDLLAVQLPAPSPKERQATWAAALTVIALGIVALFSVPGLNRLNPLMSLRPPNRLEAELDQAHFAAEKYRSSGNVFHRFEWGEYLGWSWHPNYRIYMDGRIEIYPQEVWDRYWDVTKGSKEGMDYLAQNVNFVLLDQQYPDQAGLLQAVRSSPAWREVFTGERAVLFVRVEDFMKEKRKKNEN